MPALRYAFDIASRPASTVTHDPSVLSGPTNPYLTTYRLVNHQPVTFLTMV